MVGDETKISSSGGKTHFGRTRPDVNHHLKRAFVEAANGCRCSVVLNQSRWLNRHEVKLYHRLRVNKGHAKGVVAVTRHLASPPAGYSPREAVTGSV